MSLDLDALIFNVMADGRNYRVEVTLAIYAVWLLTSVSKVIFVYNSPKEKYGPASIGFRFGFDV
jgi:hypothetical protein